ncbi:MAG: DUF429 domain-containing protein [Thermodesulfobacteriota bacterium]
MTVAALEGSEYVVGVPEPVGDLRGLIRRFVMRANGSKVVSGFDFPIGIPVAYAARAGIQEFFNTLPDFGAGIWTEFYDLAVTLAEISLHRPFYPFRPGGTEQAHLVRGLGLKSFDQLRRRCERARPDRNAACPLFWTLGANQVGRGAIIGWREVLVPAMGDEGIRVGLWPFQGNLQPLIDEYACVVVETYPAEACLHLGLTPPGRGWKKGSQKDRKEQASPILEWVEGRPLRLLHDAEAQLRDGFGPRTAGEDCFDSMIGLLSMIEVIIGGRADGAPEDEVIRKVEGWILGQEARLPGPRKARFETSIRRSL